MEEKEWIRTELKREERQKLEQRQYSVLQVLTNGRVWWLTSIYFGISLGINTFSIWAPQLMQSAASGYSNSAVGFLVMVPNLVGLAAMIFVSRSSDHYLERRNHVAIPAIIAGVGFVLLGTPHSPFFSVAFLSLLAIGVSGASSPFWALPNEFLTGFSAAAGIALINSIGNLGAFVGIYAIGAISSRTGSIYRGLALAAIPLLVSATLVILLPRRARSNLVTLGK